MNTWGTEAEQILADALNSSECYLKDLDMQRATESITKGKWYSNRSSIRKELIMATDTELKRIEVSAIALRRHRQIALEQAREDGKKTILKDVKQLWTADYNKQLPNIMDFDCEVLLKKVAL